MRFAWGLKPRADDPIKDWPAQLDLTNSGGDSDGHIGRQRNKVMIRGHLDDLTKTSIGSIHGPSSGQGGLRIKHSILDSTKPSNEGMVGFPQNQSKLKPQTQSPNTDREVPPSKLAQVDAHRIIYPATRAFK